MNAYSDELAMNLGGQTVLRVTGAVTEPVHEPLNPSTLLADNGRKLPGEVENSSLLTQHAGGRSLVEIRPLEISRTWLRPSPMGLAYGGTIILDGGLIGFLCTIGAKLPAPYIRILLSVEPGL
jgi:hypothetical protein